jgi:hypothetical protein
MRKFRNNAMTDEILFSYSNDINSILPLDFAEYPVVSFCLNPKINIKQNIVSWGTQDTTHKTNNPTVFNHFTGLHESNILVKSYNIWYEKIKRYYLMMDNTITAVTFLYDIEREKKGDGRKFSNYIKWLKETMKLNIPMVIYCEKNTYKEIKDIRDKYPLTKIIISEKENLYYDTFYNTVKQINNDKTYLKKIKGKNRLEVKFPYYNLLIMNKFKVLKDTSVKNYFDSKYFMWLDAGISRFFEGNQDKKINLNKIKDNKINIQIRSSINNNIKLEDLIFHDDHYTTATIFSGDKNTIDYLDKETEKIFHYMLEKNCINNEQIVMACLYKQDNEKFNGFLNKTSKHLPYFNFIFN